MELLTLKDLFYETHGKETVVNTIMLLLWAILDMDKGLASISSSLSSIARHLSKRPYYWNVNFVKWLTR